MAYTVDTIATMIPRRLNLNHSLLVLQRAFIWQSRRISVLFGSLIRGYPISSFLFWELEPEHMDDWDAYKFLDNASQRGAHNELTRGQSRRCPWSP